MKMELRRIIRCHVDHTENNIRDTAFKTIWNTFNGKSTSCVSAWVHEFKWLLLKKGTARNLRILSKNVPAIRKNTHREIYSPYNIRDIADAVRVRLDPRWFLSYGMDGVFATVEIQFEKDHAPPNWRFVNTKKGPWHLVLRPL